MNVIKFCNVKNCDHLAEYQQNVYTELCFKHFFKCCEDMIKSWYEDKRKTVWMFDRKKVIIYIYCPKCKTTNKNDIDWDLPDGLLKLARVKITCKKCGYVKKERIMD